MAPVLSTMMPPHSPSTRRVVPVFANHASSYRRPFDKLPLEMRTMIWCYATFTPHAIFPCRQNGLMEPAVFKDGRSAEFNEDSELAISTFNSLRETCQLFRDDLETYPALYTANTFAFKSQHEMVVYLVAITPNRRKTLKHLTVNFEVPADDEFRKPVDRWTLAMLSQCKSLKVLTINSHAKKLSSISGISTVFNELRSAVRQLIPSLCQLHLTGPDKTEDVFVYAIRGAAPSTGVSYGPSKFKGGKTREFLSIREAYVRDAFRRSGLRIFGENRLAFHNQDSKAQDRFYFSSMLSIGPVISKHSIFVRDICFDAEDHVRVIVSCPGVTTHESVPIDIFLDAEASDAQNELFVIKLCQFLKETRPPTFDAGLLIEFVKDIAFEDQAKEQRYVNWLTRLAIRYQSLASPPPKMLDCIHCST